MVGTARHWAMTATPCRLPTVLTVSTTVRSGRRAVPRTGLDSHVAQAFEGGSAAGQNRHHHRPGQMARSQRHIITGPWKRPASSAPTTRVRRDHRSTDSGVGPETRVKGTDTTDSLRKCPPDVDSKRSIHATEVSTQPKCASTTMEIGPIMSYIMWQNAARFTHHMPYRSVSHSRETGHEQCYIYSTYTTAIAIS